MKTLTLNISDEQFSNPLIMHLINVMGGEIKEVEEPVEIVKPGWQPSNDLLMAYCDTISRQMTVNKKYDSDALSFIFDNPDTFIIDMIIQLHFDAYCGRHGNLEASLKKELDALKKYVHDNTALDILIKPFYQFTRGFILQYI